MVGLLPIRQLHLLRSYQTLIIVIKMGVVDLIYYQTIFSIPLRELYWEEGDRGGESHIFSSVFIEQ